ncbi:MAG: hypothetical protein M3Q44_04140 [bacterium]|nr:hypothetical protein [bacterium]
MTNIKKLIFATALLVLVIFGLFFFTKKSTEASISQQLLLGTEDVNPHGSRTFSISPDGEWIQYFSEEGNPFDQKLIVYNVPARKKEIVSMDTATREKLSSSGGLNGVSDCWSSDSKFNYLGDVFNRQYELSVTGQPPSLDYIPESDQTSCVLPGNLNSSLIATNGKSEARLSSNGKTIASHKKSRFYSSNVLISDISVSPGSKYATYTVTEAGGSFVTFNATYIVSNLSETPSVPFRIVGDIYGPVMWCPDSSCGFAYISGTNSGKEFKGIYTLAISEMSN